MELVKVRLLFFRGPALPIFVVAWLTKMSVVPLPANCSRAERNLIDPSPTRLTNWAKVPSYALWINPPFPTVDDHSALSVGLLIALRFASLTLARETVVPPVKILWNLLWQSALATNPFHKDNYSSIIPESSRIMVDSTGLEPATRTASTCRSTLELRVHAVLKVFLR